MFSRVNRDMEAEGSTYVFSVVYGVIYGMYLVIFCLSIRALLSNPNISKAKRRFHIAFSGVVMILNALTFSSEVWLLLNTWIVHRDDPGGPLVYHNSHVLSWCQTIGDISHSLFIMLTDALYIHRFYVIFGSCRAILTLVPFYMAVIVLAGLNIAGRNPDKVDLYNSLLISSTTVLNILLTVSIYIRLRMMRQEILSSRLASLLTGINGILVESTAPLTIVGIMWSVLAAINSPLSAAFEYLWFAMGLLFPQLITLRIALGVAWSKEATTVLNSTDVGFDNLRIDPEIGTSTHDRKA